MENNPKELILICQGVRVLRPWELQALIDAIPKNDFKTMFKAALYSGMRYIELRRLQECPQWYNGHFIHLTKDAIRKKKIKMKERYVHLTPVGKEVINSFLNIKKRCPGYATWDINLQRWATKAGINPTNIGAKTTRKTWESYLVATYPEKTFAIVMSQGHDTDTSLHHYLNLAFPKEDRLSIQTWVAGFE